MIKIKIPQNSERVSLNLVSHSMHVFAFQISVFNSDGNTILEQYDGFIGNKKDYQKELIATSQQLIDKYLRLLFTITSPIMDTDYELEAKLKIGDEWLIINPPMLIEGKTNQGEATALVQLHFEKQ